MTQSKDLLFPSPGYPPEDGTNHVKPTLRENTMQAHDKERLRWKHKPAGFNPAIAKLEIGAKK
jgi:hypothetical protein